MTNLPRAPRGSYKAFLLDYDSLLTYSDDECCYSLSEREIQMLLGIIDPIAWKTRYKPTHTEIDGVLIGQWYANLARKLMSGCCGETPTNRRYGEDGILEVSYDGGVTWVDAPELDDRMSGVIAPPIPGTDGEEKRCAAAASAEEYVKQNWIEELTEGDSYAQIYAAAVALAAALGVTGVGILIAAAAAAIFIAGIAVIQAAFTTEVWTQFRCIMYCHILDDGSFDEAGWQAVKLDISTDFSGAVEIVLYNWVNTVGPVGLTNAARSGFVATADCESCDCPTGCPEKYEIWTAVLPGGPYGTIVATTDTYIDCSPGPEGYMILKATDINDCCWVADIDMVSGDYIFAGWLECGQDFAGSFNGSSPVGQCCSFIQVQASVGSVIRITLTECP